MSIQLPPLISDGMVLQRERVVSIWGISDEPVTLQFLDKQYHTVPDAQGHWSIALAQLLPGGPYTMTINERILKDVYVGDVWLCSGQSNIQIPMQRVKHMYPEELQNPNPAIRQFTVPLEPVFHEPLTDLKGGNWAGASPETIWSFSAVGYFFAKRLFERYQVPVGLLVAAMGGTYIHTWMSRGALEDYPELLEEADRCKDDDYLEQLQQNDAKEAETFYQTLDDSDPGLTAEWFSAQFNDSEWEERELLAPWSGTGSVWLRKTLEIPSELAGKPATLFLGTLFDWDMVYVNGEVVGNTTYRYPPREYVVPELPCGKCVIAIRVISKDGGQFAAGKQYLLVTDAGAINLNGLWRFNRGAVSSHAPTENFIFYKPTSLYNGMIAPLMRYAIKGALWYQGESDADNPQGYAQKFAALVQAWRKGWDNILPMILVELPHWGGGEDWYLLRQQQWLSLQMPNTAMAAAFDLGEHNDLHAQGKQIVGDRLARCAMRIAYGEKMPHSPFEIVGYHQNI